MERKGKFLFQSRDNIILIPRGAFQKRNERFQSETQMPMWLIRIGARA